MRGVLDKLISPSQNVFVPGCSIGDNILLAQELFHSYNQYHLPPRCALKVDLQKAYDTVEWDFLSAVITLFGFPAQFILWIEECVTTPSFSICLNGRVQLIKSVLTALQVYWAMAFILPKIVIREIEKRLRSFLWKGCAGVGYAKVSWQQVCRPVTEGGLGIRDILALNKGLMSRHLWRVIIADRSSIWVDWIIHYRLHGTSIWTVSDHSGSWGWRKLVRLRALSSSDSPWGPRHSSTSATAPLSTVIRDGGSFSSAAAYDVFHPPGPKVDWSSLLVGSLKIPRHRFILWLAILGRLSTLDKPWLQHLGTDCVLCRAATPETHSHLFFSCPFASECLHEIRAAVIFHWPYSSWETAIRWASARWHGKHVVNTSYRALLASLVYYLWEERNRRIFQQTAWTPVDIARTIVFEIRDLIISKQMDSSVSTRGLYRLWRIPWPVEGDAHA
ncbi:UNVERIFIED_CONTAM: hypothetical protein Slati_2464400 [Sesamum latifolium]|uniref:Reverse transcriptase zinc-binding domain-containing protein n=1 Tax=Sesamum latifolium TaxID=2727402 RepID=A0AAW2WEM3_9LAMI